METGKFVVREQAPRVIKLQHWKDTFGEVEEISSSEIGAEGAGIAKVTLGGRDVLHFHKNTEETYFCLSGVGELFLNDIVINFVPGTTVIIKPGTVHAAGPRRYDHCPVTFLCVSSPPFSRDDVFTDPRGRRWATKHGLLIPGNLVGTASTTSWTLTKFKMDRTAFNASEFNGSEEFWEIIKGYDLLTVFVMAREACEKDSLSEASIEQSEAYRVVRGAFFEEKLWEGEPGWQEWNTAIHTRFRKLMSKTAWDKIKDAKERLQKFIDNPAASSDEEINYLMNFFHGLAASL